MERMTGKYDRRPGPVCGCGAAKANRAVLCQACRREANRIYRRSYYEAYEQDQPRGEAPSIEIRAVQRACPASVAWATLDREFPWLRGAKA